MFMCVQLIKKNEKLAYRDPRPVLEVPTYLFPMRAGEVPLANMQHHTFNASEKDKMRPGEMVHFKDALKKNMWNPSL